MIYNVIRGAAMNIKDIDVKKLHNVGFVGKQDPDKLSKSLKEYHLCLFSNRKMNSGSFTFEPGKLNEMIFNNGKVKITFTPDSITHAFQYSNRKWNGTTEKETVADYCERDAGIKKLVEEYNAIDYTIGSSIVFPTKINDVSIGWTLNRARGVLYAVHDRIDHTLECIRMYYDNETENNPLADCLIKNKPFLDLYDGFKEFVDFFMLNDLVDENYKVKGYCGRINFNSPFPKTPEEYKEYMKSTNDFIKARNKRIDDWIKQL